MVQSARPEIYARVPSRGSTIHASGMIRSGKRSYDSSDSQPAAGASVASRSCSSSFTAISASLTGDWSAPLVQRLKGPRAVVRARSPASRNMASRGSRNAIVSLAGNGQAFHAQCRRIGAVAEFKVVGRRQRTEHLKQMSGDGDLADRVSSLAILDPETGSAAAVIASHHIDANTDQIGNIESVRDVGNQSFGA